MRKWLLAGVLILGLLLRIISLGTHPAGFTPDEASFGYDAYSLLQTGRDQWGESWPISFRSFGDFKLPLYTYLSLPSIAIFGLNEFAVRLPNAILGTLAIVLTYYLTKKLFNNESAALFGAFLLAISPWHVPLSRGAFEANLTTFLLPLGILLFYKGLATPRYLYLASIAFGLNLFSYHSARLLTPLIVLFLVLTNYRKIGIKRSSLSAAVIFFVFCIAAGLTIFGGSSSRISTSGIFNPTGGWSAVADERFAALKAGEADSLARLFNNKLTYFVAVMSSNYFQYFSPQFLFTQGPAEGTYGMVPGMGVLYIFELIFLAYFILGSIHKKSSNAYYLDFLAISFTPCCSFGKRPWVCS